MRKMSKKIIVSVLTLVLTVVALGTTTYAWFTVGGTVATDELEMKVTSGVGLEIAYLHSGLNEESGDLRWVKTITADRIYGYLYNDYYGFLTGHSDLDDVTDNIGNYATAWNNTFVMDAFTSANGVDMQYLNEDGDDLVPTADPKGGYIQFTLAFRTKENLDPSNGLQLYLNELTYSSTSINWKPEVDFTEVGGNTFKATDSPKPFFAVNGARISLEDGLNGGAKVFEKANGTGNVQLSDNEPNWAEGAHAYYQAVTTRDLESVFGNTGTAYVAAVTKTALDPSGEVVAEFVDGTGGVYRYATVTIRIYLEGFDSETFNAIFDDVIRARFGFNIDIS